jgi:S1-C subfamily serine protease
MSDSRRSFPYWILILIVIVLVIGGLLRSGFIRIPGNPVHAAPSVDVQVAQGDSPVSLADFKNGFSSVVDPALAAVVNISSTKVGVQQGDVIQEVNRKPVHSVQQYRQALAGAANQPVLLLVNHGGTTHYIVVEPQG